MEVTPVTEAWWKGATDPVLMLEWLCYGEYGESLSPHPYSRKLRLCVCAFCRQIWHLLNDPRSRNAVIVAEQFADGLVTAEHLFKVNQQAVYAAYAADPSLHHDAETSLHADSVRHLAAADAVRMVSTQSILATALAALNNVARATSSLSVEMMRPEQGLQATLVREIFGNPFREVTVDPTWLTSTVVSLAQGIYDERAFDRLPILADALEDAGCTNADMLNHCRQPGEHVRGCWPLDLLLGKE